MRCKVKNFKTAAVLFMLVAAVLVIALCAQYAQSVERLQQHESLYPGVRTLARPIRISIGQQIPADDIPTVKLENGVRVRIIAGRVSETGGAVREIAADPTYLDVSIPANTKFVHPIPVGHTAFAYVFSGSGIFGITRDDDGESVTAPHLVVLDDGDEVRIKALENGVRFLLISGKPLNEPIVRYGPFVMNTEAEIELALLDLRRGTFVK